MKNIIIKMLDTGTPKPFNATEGSAGFDIAANEDFIIKPTERKLVGTGLCFEIPYGYEMQIRPRSGLAAKYGVTVLNAPATIDSDFRAEIKVLLINHGVVVQHFKKGDRIAQGIIAPVIKASFELVSELSTTERGSGGFGSTGV